MKGKVLVTGGAGYIGSHTVLELLENSFEVVVVDNLSNSSEESLKRVSKICNKDIDFHKVDLLDVNNLDKVFQQYSFDSIIHFAAFKAVGESVEKPIKYYDNNIVGTINLIKMMLKYNVKNFVFSSSATVYGEPEKLPIVESASLSATNPYGWTKLMMEQILEDAQKANENLNVAVLRYFNPVGAHKSGLIGEDPNGIPDNIMPFISQVAIGRREELNVFGNDYPTTDGTGVRDYIHIVDLANGHIAALNKLQENIGYQVYNLGTGNGYSVLELVKAFEKASGKTVKYKVVERRPGDIAECFANPEKANLELNWKAKFGIDEMCEDTWRWQKNNPEGFNS